MAKKFLLSLVIALIVLGSFSLYGALKYRNELRQARLNQPLPKKEEISLTFVEGLNNKEIAAFLAQKGVVDTADGFLKDVKDFDTTKYSAFLPKEAAGNLQGFLYPDTYRFFKDITDRSVTSSTAASNIVIDKLLTTFDEKIPADASQLAKAQGLSLYEAITLASIVEKETGREAVTGEQRQGLDAERAIIAGIFYNRLKIGMALESDATVNYVTGKNDPAVSSADTQINSPYNTYKYPGLPPTPIANPSLSSILSVLHPTQTDYMYFLHDQTTGKAYYAKTYDEQLANKQKYLK